MSRTLLRRSSDVMPSVRSGSPRATGSPAPGPGGPADDELERQVLPWAGSPSIAAEQQLGAHRAADLQRLCDRGQARVAGQLDVVEADHRQLLGHPHASGVRAAIDHGERLQVGGGEDRGRRVGERQQLPPMARLRPSRAGAARELGRAAAPAVGERAPRSRSQRRALERAPCTSSTVSPANAIRRWPSSSRCSVASRPPSTSSTVDRRQRSCAWSTSTTGTLAARSRARSASVGRERDREQAVDAADQRAAERRVALLGARRRTGSAGSRPSASAGRRRAGARSPTGG